MFKSKFKITLIAAAIASFVLLGFVSSSNAIVITQMVPTDGSYEPVQYYNQYLDHTEKVITDVPYSRIEWYVDDQLKGTTTGDGVKTEAVYQPYHLIGSAEGTAYEIEAIAYPWEGDGSDTDSFILTVYKADIIEEMRSSDGTYTKLTRFVSVGAVS